MTTVKPWYKRKVFWTAVIAALGAALDIGVGEQSTIVEVLMLTMGIF